MYATKSDTCMRVGSIEAADADSSGVGTYMFTNWLPTRVSGGLLDSTRTSVM